MLEKLPDAVGEALGDVRAGLAQTVFQGIDLRQGMGALTVASVAFEDHAPLPQRYTADGAGLSPPLHWRGVPEHTAEVVLIVEDADSPTPQPLVHAIAHGLVPGEDGCGALAEGVMNPVAVGDDHMPLVAMGRNSLLMTRWLPPDPPPGHGVHRYVFQVFALEAGAALPATPGREALCEALLKRAIASGCLIGTYERPSGHIPESLAQTAPLAPA